MVNVPYCYECKFFRGMLKGCSKIKSMPAVSGFGCAFGERVDKVYVATLYCPSCELLMGKINLDYDKTKVFTCKHCTRRWFLPWIVHKARVAWTLREFTDSDRATLSDEVAQMARGFEDIDNQWGA